MKTRWVQGHSGMWWQIIVPEPMTPAERAKLFDPIENAKAALRLLGQRPPGVVPPVMPDEPDADGGQGDAGEVVPSDGDPDEGQADAE